VNKSDVVGGVLPLANGVCHSGTISKLWK
jgi:hypothetical protein